MTIQQRGIDRQQHVIDRQQHVITTQQHVIATCYYITSYYCMAAGCYKQCLQWQVSLFHAVYIPGPYFTKALTLVVQWPDEREKEGEKMWRCRPVASWWCHWAHRHSPATDHQCSQRWDIKGKEEHFHRKVNEVSNIFTSPLYPTRPQHWLCRPSSLSQAEAGTPCLQPAQCTGVWINRHSLTLLPVGTDTQTHDSRQHTETW